VQTRVLDHGFVRVVDVMGTDSSIVQAARVSYGAGTKTKRDDDKLLRYLYEHQHTGPFEMCEVKLHIKAPIFVARQWMRHRTWSYNEVSGRYSELPMEFYCPLELRMQDSTNKQGSTDLTLDTLYLDAPPVWAYDCAATSYKQMLERGICREQARMVLPLATYTEFYAKTDLRNLLHFLDLRCDEHAQWEMRQYADAIAEMVRHYFPVTMEVWGNG
jgi:thymidylate synthase (FAD)